ncbi:beta-phosphoglucomutase-like phosphatase (HAD superfamily) [Sinorhizobium fredii]
MTGIDLIIFDCDGVLVDSEIIASEVEAELLTEAGYPISIEEMSERFAGMDLARHPAGNRKGSQHPAFRHVDRPCRHHSRQAARP